MKKRILAMALCAAMTCAAMTGCSGGAEPAGTDGNDTKAVSDEGKTDSGAASDQITLKVLDTYGGMVEDMLAYYEELNPNIKIDYEFVSSESYYAKFTALNVANELPDVIFTNANYMVEQVQSDLLVDLTEEINNGQNYEEDGIWGETFNETLLQNSRDLMKSVGSEYENKSFGVPFTMTTIAVIYDKAVFEELGLKVPETWEEFEKNNEAIKAAGLIPVSMQQQNLDWWPRILWDQYCREELDANPKAFEDGSMTFDEDSVRQGIEKFKEMWDAGWFPESGLTGTRETMQQLFVQKEMVQLLIQPNYLTYLTENVPEGVELATYALPGAAGLPPRCLGGSSTVYSVTKASQHQDEAIRLIKFMTSKTAFSEEYAQFVNSGLTNLEETTDSEVFQGYIDAGENGFIPDIYVPVNVTTEMANTFRTDLLPNYLMGVYELDYVVEQLNTLYQDGYLSTLE